MNLQKLRDKPFQSNNNDIENNNIIKFKTGSFFNNSMNNIKDVYNKNIIRKNKSNSTRNILYNLKIPNFKMYKKLANNNCNIHIINTDKNEEKNNYNIKYNTNAFQNINYNQKENLKKILNLKNSLNDNLNKNINIIKNNNKDNDKIFSENLSLNFKNNKIVIPKNLKINHISPEQYNRYRLKLINEINNSNIKPNKQHNITYRNNKIKLSLGNKKILNNFNIIRNNKTFINTQNIYKVPMKNIKIINIISPINKITNYYKVKKNSFCSKVNLYKTNDIAQIDNSNNKDMTINYWERNKNKDLLFDYYSNSSLIDKSRQKNNNLIFNYEHFNNQYKDKISKVNTYFINNKLNTYNRNNFININLNKNIIGGSFDYHSPKLIEKYKTSY